VVHVLSSANFRTSVVIFERYLYYNLAICTVTADCDWSQSANKQKSAITRYEQCDRSEAASLTLVRVDRICGALRDCVLSHLAGKKLTVLWCDVHKGGFTQE